jgi:hypothetical protein
MGFATVITWFATVLMGLFMLAVWLIENDVTGQGVAPSRLPVPVIFCPPAAGSKRADGVGGLPGL